MKKSIGASATVPVAYARARRVLVDDPAALFGRTPAPEDRRARRFREELSIGLGSGTSLHQEVVLRVGVPRPDEGRLFLPLTWQSTGRRRILPVFEGDLEVSDCRAGTDLRLHGTYTAPLGRFGSCVSRRLARRSLDVLVERVAERLDAATEEPSRSHDRQAPGPLEGRKDRHLAAPLRSKIAVEHHAKARPGLDVGSFDLGNDRLPQGSPALAGADEEVTPLLFEPGQRMHVVRNRLDAVVRDLDELVTERRGSRDFALVTGLGQVSHAVHRALVTLEEGMGIEHSTSGGAG